MAAGGVQIFHNSFAGLFCEVRRARGPYPGSYAGSPQPADPSPTLEEILEREGERVAAVLIEPMLQGAGGMIVWPADFLRQVRSLTRAHGIPLIADEVFTGFGRTGSWFACEHGDLEGAPCEPDLMCLSKGLTAGYLPMAVTLASEEIYTSFLSDDRGRTFFHGHSFTGNALSCAVALESLAILDEEGSLARVGRLEALFRQRLARLADHPQVADTRGIGAMAAIELAPRDGGGYLDGVGPWLYQRFLERGLLLRPLGNVVYFLPPYVVTDAECHQVFDAIEEVLGLL
jgi:adenosylmethionine-8-amino-7-oxononanoate aminotransferase